MEPINERFRELRKLTGMSQEAFAQKASRTRSEIKNIEYGKTTPKEEVIKAVCKAHKANEIWLRTGVGEPFDDEASREVEMTELFAELMSDRPEAFRTRLVTTLLRFRPDGPEWAILERIYEQIKKEADAMEAKEKETDS